MQEVVIYTDGACSGNPGKGGFGWIMALPDGQVREGGGAAEVTTNNRMELQAVVEVLETLPHGLTVPVRIHSDSIYVLHGITKWSAGWVRRGWVNAQGQPVANQDLWQQLLAVVGGLKGQAVVLDWLHVRGHVGIPGNERADFIATRFAAGEDPGLYQGALSEYGYDLSVKAASPVKAKPVAAKTGAGRSQGSGKKPWGYISCVAGVFSVHKTWGECEAMVKGQSRARYRKVFSEQEVEQWRREWLGG